MVLEPVEGLVEMAGIATRADGDQGEQPCVAGGVLARRGGHKAAHLRQGVVEDVRQPVAVGDQMLDGVEPVAAAAFACANRPSSLGITVRVKKSALTSITFAASRIASSAARSSTHARGLPAASPA